MKFKNCKQGNHNLVPIFSCGTYDEASIVRWCSICGAVVVDKEVDGRVSPGAIRKLQAPQLAINFAKNKISS